MATNKKNDTIEISRIKYAEIPMRIVGDSPLIMHAWSAKAKREMLEKQIGATKTTAREKKNPIEDFVSSMYWLTPMPEEMTYDAVSDVIGDAKFGFPVTAFKQAAISAAYRMGWAKDKMSMRGAFFITANANGYYAGDLAIDHDANKVTIIPNQFRSEQLIVINSDTPQMREDMVRVGMGTADIRYRGEFSNWWADIVVRYNENGQYTAEQIVNIINAGGSVCGVGEWRPEKDGQSGMFHVESI